MGKENLTPEQLATANWIEERMARESTPEEKERAAAFTRAGRALLEVHPIPGPKLQISARGRELANQEFKSTVKK